MTKKVDLISYLPPFMADFKEMSVTLEAENPEFVLLWNGADKVLKNMFIETADEYGISRFEKMLNILPSVEDTLEYRRIRVKINWFKNANYTYKYLIAQLTEICGISDFDVTLNCDEYTIKITVPAEYFVDIQRLLKEILPCNLVQMYRTNTDECFCIHIGAFIFASRYTELNPLFEDIYSGIGVDMIVGSGVVSIITTTISTEIIVPNRNSNGGDIIGNVEVFPNVFIDYGIIKKIEV